MAASGPTEQSDDGNYGIILNLLLLFNLGEMA